jgi:hypothetical protein
MKNLQNPRTIQLIREITNTKDEQAQDRLIADYLAYLQTLPTEQQTQLKQAFSNYLAYRFENFERNMQTLEEAIEMEFGVYQK